MIEHPCQICGAEIPDWNRRRVTCGKPECGTKWEFLRRKEYREAHYVPKPKRVKVCVMCGKEFTALAMNQLTCGLECRRIRSNEQKAAYIAAHKDKADKKQPKPTGPMKRFCPRCRKPSYEYEYCKRCKDIIERILENYDESSIAAGW